MTKLMSVTMFVAAVSLNIVAPDAHKYPAAKSGGRGRAAPVRLPAGRGTWRPAFLRRSYGEALPPV